MDTYRRWSYSSWYVCLYECVLVGFRLKFTVTQYPVVTSALPCYSEALSCVLLSLRHTHVTAAL